MRAPLLVLTVLVGCATAQPQESLEVRLDRAYGERCRLAGYTPSTPAYGQCLLAASDRNEQARRDAELQMLQMRPAGNPNYVDPNLFRSPQQTCTAIVNGQIVTTTCR